MQDVIEREVTIRAPREKIYQAIADPTEVVKWFPETVEGSYAVGEQPIFGFGEHGKSRIYVVEARPHDYFAYRWIPGANSFLGDVLKEKTTLVEFTIKEEGDGRCVVTMTESGFSSLPAETIEERFNQNSEGWAYMLDRLEKLFKS